MVQIGYLLFKVRGKKPFRLDYSSKAIGIVLGFFRTESQAIDFAKANAKANKRKYKLLKKY
jgi:hypothetical protein